MKKVLVLIGALAFSQAAIAQQDRSNMWEFGLLLNNLSSESLAGSNGSSIDVDSSTGFGVSMNYNFSNHFALGGEFSWNRPDYSAVFVPTDPMEDPETINYELDSVGVNLKAVWNIIDGPRTP